MGGQYRPPIPPSYREGPYSWPSREQRTAFAEALNQLFEVHPARHRWQLKVREEAVHYALSGVMQEARTCAISGGVPEDHLKSIEALLF